MKNNWIYVFCTLLLGVVVCGCNNELDIQGKLLRFGVHWLGRVSSNRLNTLFDIFNLTERVNSKWKMELFYCLTICILWKRWFSGCTILPILPINKVSISILRIILGRWCRRRLAGRVRRIMWNQRKSNGEELQGIQV